MKPPENRTYFSFNDFLRKTFPFKVYKIPLDVGFTCPNRDGSLGYGGCIYCENRSFSPNTVEQHNTGTQKTVSEQIEEGMTFYRANRKAERFIAYFQAYTNTYGTLEHLRRQYDEALSFPEVVGLSIGTRPDCVPDETLDLLQEYAAKTHLWVEYGLESMVDATLEWVRRGHSFAQFVDAMRRTKARGLRVCVHIILGFPGETHAMMMKTAETLACMDIDGVKIHHLYVSKHTAMEKMFRSGQIPVLTLENYIPLVCDFLERLPSGVAVQRLMGEIDGEYLVAPHWQSRKQEILRDIEGEFRRRGTRQGSRVSETASTASI